jgi:predicted  nucleic acid-binding Zn-ribbon protein
MHPDLQLLIELQDVDSAADRAKRRLAELPSLQQALESRIAARTGEVTAVKERIAAGKAARAETEKQVAAVQTRLSKYKGQLTEVKSNKEYTALLKEIATAEQDVRTHEDRLLERMEEAEVLAAELKAAEAQLKTEQAEVAKQQAALEAERGQLEKEFSRVTEARAAVTAKLSRETLMLFERVAHGRKGIAVAEARAGLCTVCHVRLRPQMFNDVRRNDGIYQCGNCTRILYFVPSAQQSA